MILITKTYTECTPESAEDGDYSDQGVIQEDESYTFGELVRALREHRECSEYPVSDSTFTWFSSGFDMVDYQTGTERETAIHYSRANPPRNAKHWAKAIRFVFGKSR